MRVDSDVAVGAGILGEVVCNGILETTQNSVAHNMRFILLWG
jgi:hypothetical protein